MKKLDTTQETTTIGQPFGGQSNLYLQNAYAEIAQACLAPLIHNINEVTVLSGCGYTFSSPTFTINSGWTFYNGEVYKVDAQSVTTGGTNVTVVGVLSVTDPIGSIAFTDNINRTVFNERKIILSASTTGTGISGNANSDFLNWKQLGGSWSTYTFPASSFTGLFASSFSAQTAQVWYKVYGKTMHSFWNLHFETAGANLEALLTYSALFTDNGSPFQFTTWQYDLLKQNQFIITTSGNFAGGTIMSISIDKGGINTIPNGKYSFAFEATLQID